MLKRTCETGNVILLTLGIASSDHRIQLHSTAVSLASYLLTGFAFGQIGQRVGLRKRWWLFTSNVLQTLVLATVCILEGYSRRAFDDPSMQWVFLLLLAASSGPQVAIARNCGNGEVPTAMLSSPM